MKHKIIICLGAVLLSGITVGTTVAASDDYTISESENGYLDTDDQEEQTDWTLYREYFDQESYHEDMKMYYEYVQEQGLNNIMKDIQGGFEDEMLIQKVKIADFDQDGRVEVWLRGPGASANTQAAILDIKDGKVDCVFCDWGTELGQYENPETGENGLVIMEGNGEGDQYFHNWLGFYDKDWNQTILCEGSADGGEGTYYGGDGNEITRDEYDQIWSEVREQCTDIKSVFERDEDSMDDNEVLYILYLAEQGEA